jgi:5-methylcytosine-specific restriction endonuclease McrA
MKFIPLASEAESRRERQRARQLRNSSWWRRKCSRGLCYFCGRRFPPQELTMEHLVPLVRGGRSTKSNLVPACKDCNSRKKYLLPTEWQQYLEGLRRS